MDQPQLLSLCRQFEAALLRSILPSSMFGQRALEANSQSDDARADESVSDAERSGQLDNLFSEAFAQALERAGGVGLAAELYRSLNGHRSRGANP